VDRRTVVNGIFYLTRVGCAWRLLPKAYGPWETIDGYYRRWTQDWTWQFIHDTLRDYVRQSEGRRVAPSAALIDRPSVKVPDQAGERG
jgi:putative transposase